MKPRPMLSPDACRAFRTGPWGLTATAILTTVLASSAAFAADPPRVLMPAGSSWRYIADYPEPGWEQARFDDRHWKEGNGGFGDGGPLAKEVTTPWRSGQIWLRITVDLPTVPGAPQLFIQHRADVQVYVNGRQVADISGNTPRFVPLPVQGAAQASLRKGANLIAVHATCIGDSPFIDLRLEEAAPPGKVPAPLHRDPRFDGAADPMVIWNRGEKCWTLFYSQRRANLKELPGVGYCYGTDIGMALSRDGGRTWTYGGEALGLEYEGGRNSWWAPEVVFIDGQYHMFVSRIQGVHTTWTGPATMTHFTSHDLKHWTFSEELPMRDVIDASVFPLPTGGWRMYYKQDSKTLMVDSTDLRRWVEVGVAADDAGQEGPNVFRWKGHYWMIADVWHGQQVYRSGDLKTWTLQEGGTILGSPGRRRDDAAFGRHADVVVQGDRAFILYFTHPGGDTDHEQATSLKRTSVQVAELEFKDGKIVCDRNKPLDYRWSPDLLDW